MLARYAPAGNKTLLTDALNSVIAQASDTQAIENYYAYSPYGEAQTLGPDGGNPLQYTGRENDGTGLMYYRARYYDPVLKRFVSEDPIGIAGGLNLAAYVAGDPVSSIEPDGLLFTTTLYGLRNDMTLDQAVVAGTPGTAAAGAAVALGATATTAAVGGAGLYGYFGVLSGAIRAAIGVAKGISTDAMPPPTVPSPPISVPPAICRPGFNLPPTTKPPAFIVPK